MDFPVFLPWQTVQASHWLGNRSRFAHAWLIHGQQGTGKRQFARAAAASLLCEQPAHGLACGRCPACQWLQSGNHPDLRLIRPDAMALEEGDPAITQENENATTPKALSRDIRIEQIRTLSGWFTTATHRGGFRVAVIYPAQSMNTITANALLKVLEEPPEHTVFLLVADAPDQLLPTIVSRCRLLATSFPAPEQSLAWLNEKGVKQAADWLAVAGGAPLLAHERSLQDTQPCPGWLEAIVQALGTPRFGQLPELADAMEKEQPVYWIDMLQRLMVDLMLAASGVPVRYYMAHAERLERIAQGADPQALADQARWLTRQRGIATHPLNAKVLVHTALQRLFLACVPQKNT
ncbi:MAG: DNA polymerase III subunit delta' [Alcaligenaceae bacterium]|nr:DNA polymerase III subunit delta' [Alcaligenaceae bacterium]